MSDISFKIQVSPEVVKKYNEDKVEKLANKYGLNKEELNKDGIDITEADGMQLKTFQQLSANTGLITKATLIKFDDGAETPAEKIANELKRNLPTTMQVTGPRSKDAGETIVVQSKLGNTVDQVFTMVGGNDKNRDGMLDVGSEIVENDMVKTTNDAVELGGKDLKATPDEAMKFYIKKKGVTTENITVTSQKAQPLNTKLGELLKGFE